MTLRMSFCAFHEITAGWRLNRFALPASKLGLTGVNGKQLIDNYAKDDGPGVV